MKRSLLVVLLLACGVGPAAPVHSGTQDEAKVALHMQMTCDKCDVSICDRNSPNTLGVPCGEYTTTYVHPGGTGARLWVVVAQADSAAGVAAVQFALDYGPAYVVFDWTLCADDDFRHGNAGGDPWPASGSGNRIVWDPEINCQRTVLGSDGVHAVAGAFYLYAYGAGEFAVVPDASEGAAGFLVTDCAGRQSEAMSPGGVLGHLVNDGFNPCTDDVPVSPTSWSHLKQNYRR